MSDISKPSSKSCPNQSLIPGLTPASLSRRQLLSSAFKQVAFGSVAISALSLNLPSQLYNAGSIGFGALGANGALRKRQPKVINLRAQLSSGFCQSKALDNLMCGYLAEFGHEVLVKSEGSIVLDRTPWGEKTDFVLFPTLARASKLPALTLLGLPDSLGTPESHLQWLQRIDTENTWAEIYKDKGIHPLSFGVGGFSVGHASHRQILALEDFKSLRSCSHQRGDNWLERCGVQFKTVNNAEQVASLIKDGTIDISSPMQHSVHLALNTLVNTPIYYSTAWTELLSPYELSFKADVWNKLPKDCQKIMRDAAHTVGQRIVKNKLRSEENALVALKQIPNKQIEPMPLNVKSDLKEISASFARSLSLSNFPAAQLYALTFEQKKAIS